MAPYLIWHREDDKGGWFSGSSLIVFFFSCLKNFSYLGFVRLSTWSSSNLHTPTRGGVCSVRAARLSGETGTSCGQLNSYVWILSVSVPPGSTV